MRVSSHNKVSAGSSPILVRSIDNAWSTTRGTVAPVEVEAMANEVDGPAAAEAM
jgi:hypothetical protein